MTDSSGLSIPPFTTQDAHSQLIDIQWQNLSVYVGMPKSNTARNQVSDDLSSPLLLKGKSSQAQFDNVKAQELSQASSKYTYRCILDNQCGFARRGELLAIMGPSGAGKTTMIACLSQRLAQSKTTVRNGSITANGMAYNSNDFCNFGVFVMQNDLLLATFTVKEAIEFSAALRLKANPFERAVRVEQLIKDLKLQACQHTFIGNHIIKGISGGERKRTSIAVELIADPPVLMLDEPTSGLDSFTAFVLVDILRKIATRQKRTILFTIHQPSTDIYDLLDRLLLLNNGQTVYQGSAKDLVPYLRGLNMLIPKFSNPCDFFMNELRAQHTQLINENYQILQAEQSNKELMQTEQKTGFVARDLINNFSYEFRTLSRRHITNYFRNPQMFQARIFITIFMSAFPSILYWHVGKKHLPEDPPDVQPSQLINQYVLNISGTLFFICTGQLFSTMGPLIQLFPIEREIFLKEENSRQYRVSSYFLSKLCIEIPFTILTPIVSASALYYCLSLRAEWDSFFDMATVFMLVTLCGNGLGVFGGSLFSNPRSASAMVPLLILPLQIFGGQYSNLGTLGRWISWFKYLSPFFYFQEANMRTQFDGVNYLEQDPLTGVVSIFDPIQQLGFNFGLKNCIIVLALLGVGLHMLAMLVLKLLVKRINV